MKLFASNAITVKWGFVYTRNIHTFIHTSIMIITIIMILSLCNHLPIPFLFVKKLFSLSLTHSLIHFFHIYPHVYTHIWDLKMAHTLYGVHVHVHILFAWHSSTHSIPSLNSERDTHSLIRIFNHTRETFRENNTHTHSNTENGAIESTNILLKP